MAVLGVLFVRGYQANHQIASQSTATTPQPTDQATLQLDVSSPSADIATSSATLTVSGTTSQSAIVSVTGGASDIIMPAQSNGTFSFPVSLNQGLNQLQITAYTEEGDSALVKHNVVYSKNL